jgi:hypothetical protein
MNIQPVIRTYSQTKGEVTNGYVVYDSQCSLAELAKAENQMNFCISISEMRIILLECST